MTTKIWWHQPNKILYVQRIGIVDIQSVDEANLKVYEILESLEPNSEPIYILTDSTQVTEITATIHEIRDLESAQKVVKHSKLNRTIYFDRQNAMYDYLTRAFSVTFNEDSYTTDSLEDALALIDGWQRKSQVHS